MATCIDTLSASLKTVAVRIPSLFAVRITRQAISPRFATKILSKSLTSLPLLGAVDVHDNNVIQYERIYNEHADDTGSIVKNSSTAEELNNLTLLIWFKDS